MLEFAFHGKSFLMSTLSISAFRGITSRQAWLVSCTLPFCVVSGAAESVVSNVPRPQYTNPSINPSTELKGVALVEALRRGGYVLYLRHTENDTITEECSVSNLSPRGVQEAIRVGQALRTMKLPIGKILSSDICRVRETAKLLDVGNFEIVEDLSNDPKRSGRDVHAARMRLLATLPSERTNLLLVSHMHAGNSIEQKMDLDLGEVIVFRPDGKGRSDAIARIRVDDWARLNRIDEPAARIAISNETPAK